MNFYCDHTRCTLKVVHDLMCAGGGQKFILYPFGDLGKRVKSILNVYLGVQEYLIVDNYLSKQYERIKSVDGLTEDDVKDAIVLIASDAEAVYEDLREVLYQKVPREQCVELFPRSIPVRTMGHIGETVNDLAFCLWHLARMQTAEYIAKTMPAARMHENRYKLLEHIFLDNLVTVDGMYLEFGVREGTSANFIAAYNPTKRLYGFDSFEGLPEDWIFCSPKGTFNLNGIMPRVNYNVSLIKGWFDETLPEFLARHPEKCAFVHIDSDLYSSAKTVLSLLQDRITHGTVIEFDDYFGYPGWQEGEFKAFQEFIDECQMDYEYIGYAAEPFQCAIKIR